VQIYKGTGQHNKDHSPETIAFAAEIGGFQDTASKHSIAIQPVVSVPQPEYSQYSQASGRHSRGNDFVL